MAAHFEKFFFGQTGFLIGDEQLRARLAERTREGKDERTVPMIALAIGVRTAFGRVGPRKPAAA
ncbi:MAG: hypothetical protein V4659_09800 [Pseudomonadota bacterium]